MVAGSAVVLSVEGAAVVGAGVVAAGTESVETVDEAPGTVVSPPTVVVLTVVETVCVVVVNAPMTGSSPSDVHPHMKTGTRNVATIRYLRLRSAIRA